jgi:hypothetical protein
MHREGTVVEVDGCLDSNLGAPLRRRLFIMFIISCSLSEWRYIRRSRYVDGDGWQKGDARDNHSAATLPRTATNNPRCIRTIHEIDAWEQCFGHAIRDRNKTPRVEPNSVH